MNSFRELYEGDLIKHSAMKCVRKCGGEWVKLLMIYNGYNSIYFKMANIDLSLI